MIGEFVITLALLAVQLFIVGIGLLVFCAVWFAVSEAVTRRPRVTVERRPGYLPPDAFSRIVDASYTPGERARLDRVSQRRRTQA